MAIITENTNTNPMVKAVFAISQDTPFVKTPNVLTSISFCVCDYECEYFNYVFADTTTSEDFKNDKSSFLYSPADDSSTLQIILVKGDEEIEILDNTFGKYFAKGSFTNTQNQLNYVGFIADWKKILTLGGAGVYYFKFVETTFGEEYVKETIKYRLLNYNEELIQDTIRFKFQQDGIIENGIDYTGLNWVTQVRVQGKLKYLAPILEQDNYLNNGRVVTQIQDKKIRQFEITTNFIPSAIGDLLENGALSNKILITNYNWFAYKRFEDLEIHITEISDLKTGYENNSLGAFVFTAEERIKNTVKRNV